MPNKDAIDLKTAGRVLEYLRPYSLDDRIEMWQFAPGMFFAKTRSQNYLLFNERWKFVQPKDQEEYDLIRSSRLDELGLRAIFGDEFPPERRSMASLTILARRKLAPAVGGFWRVAPQRIDVEHLVFVR